MDKDGGNRGGAGRRVGGGGLLLLDLRGLFTSFVFVRVLNSQGSFQVSI